MLKGQRCQDNRMAVSGVSIEARHAGLPGSESRASVQEFSSNQGEPVSSSRRLAGAGNRTTKPQAPGMTRSIPGETFWRLSGARISTTGSLTDPIPSRRCSRHWYRNFLMKLSLLTRNSPSPKIIECFLGTRVELRARHRALAE
jgi:hypothetical protein